MIVFAKTREERLASGDPRLSLEERYGDHEGYVNAVRAAAAHAVAEVWVANWQLRRHRQLIEPATVRLPSML